MADEIGKLAADSEAQTRRIATVVAATHSDLGRCARPSMPPAPMATASPTRTTRARPLRRIGELAEQLTEPAERVAAAAEEQLQALGEMSGHMQGSVLAVTEVDEHATQMSAQALGLSASSEDVYELLRPFWTDFVDRAGEVGRRLAGEIGGVLEGVVDSGAASLADVLDPRYEEITGPRIASLRRLFDVSRVPLSGFDPPKFSTAYDHLVEEPLMAVYDRTLAENPWLVLAAGSDLNVYAPVHARPLCADWTGDPAQDLLGNRIKRILTDNPALVRANRVGIGRELPHRVLTRAEMRAAGADLVDPPAASSAASCRPTRATPADLHRPVGSRLRPRRALGRAVIGWDPDSVAT